MECQVSIRHQKRRPARICQSDQQHTERWLGQMPHALKGRHTIGFFAQFSSSHSGSPAMTPMMAMVIRSSTKVNPRRQVELE